MWSKRTGTFLHLPPADTVKIRKAQSQLTRLTWMDPIWEDNGRIMMDNVEDDDDDDDDKAVIMEWSSVLTNCSASGII